MNAEMTLPFSGGCVCGAIRYQCAAEPIMMGKCHCRDCQRISGGAFVPFLIVPANVFRVTQGKLSYHFTESLRGGKHKRSFCAECGSRLTGAELETPSPMTGVVAGSLDDPTWFRPQMDIFTEDAQPWDEMDPALPKFERYPLMPEQS